MPRKKAVASAAETERTPAHEHPHPGITPHAFLYPVPFPLAGGLSAADSSYVPHHRACQFHQNLLEEQRDCSEVLVQLSAVRAALNNLGKIILEEHINQCVVDVVSLEDMESKQEVLHQLNDAIDKFIR